MGQIDVAAAQMPSVDVYLIPRLQNDSKLMDGPKKIAHVEGG